MKNNFRGWTSVFSFTFKQATKGKGFKVATIIVSILILAAFILTNILAAKPDNDGVKTDFSPIQTVYVLDQSGLAPTDYKAVTPVLNQMQFNHIEFINVTDQTRAQVIDKASSNSTQTIAVIITETSSGYEIEAVVPEGAGVAKGHAETLLGPISSGFNANKLVQSGLTEEQLSAITKPILTSFSDIGEETNEITLLIKTIAPMLFGLILYMMLLLHGQTVSKSVSTEKTSKLMETLLTSIHPYAMITGKVLAITAIALLQFLTWIIATFVGLYGGTAIARMLYPEYRNTAINIINFLRDNIGEAALSLPAVVMAIVFFAIGFLFYSVIAALAGCMVSKPEDVASTQTLFQIPVIISWLFSYLAPLMQYDRVTSVIRYIPLTSPFSVPVDLITGAMGLVEGLISLIILILFTFLTIIFASKLYKGLVLYTGQKINVKIILKILKSNQ